MSFSVVKEGFLTRNFSRFRVVSLVLALSIVLVIGILSSLLFRDNIYDFYSYVENQIVYIFGIGAILIGLWLFIVILSWMKGWLQVRHINLWLGSIILIATGLGVLDFFQPDNGFISKFTLDGDVSLGGNVGHYIVGSVTWIGVLRVLGIGMVGVLVIMPVFAVYIGRQFERTSKYLYKILVNALFRLSIYMWSFFVLLFYRLVTYVRSFSATAIKVVVQSFKLLIIRKFPGYNSSAQTQDLESNIRPTNEVLGQSQFVFSSVTGESFQPVSIENVQKENPQKQQDRRKFNKIWDSNASIGSDILGQELNEDTSTKPSTWLRPSLDILKGVSEGGVTDDQIDETANTIKQTLGEYGVEVDVGQIKPGPTVTMYGLIPGWIRRYKQVKEMDDEGQPILDELGKPIVKRVESRTRVKVDSILSREKDLALALKTPSIRIETPVMGKSLLGIEVPNPNASLVTLRSAMESEEFAKLLVKAELPVALGKGSGGETVVTDLAKMPHLLIAGATGSGKSACLNAIISCLIMEKTPEEMRLLLIDPKRVELTPYNDIPHLLTPVVVETDIVVGLLKGLIQEMLDRYRLMEEVGVRNIAAYNNKMPNKMPFLVVAVDELADLMMSASFYVEQSLCRLAQLGRATGIHLIVATQRPSVDVVTGLIKANFPSRISFGVTSQIDSRTILDSVGAEKLLGKGDMLYIPLDASRPSRVQGVFISDREIEDLVAFWQATPRGPLSQIDLSVLEDVHEEDHISASSMSPDRDELLDKAIEMSQNYSKLSTSLLQRRLRIGYPRAGRLMDQLEELGIVGPGDGSKSRDVINNKV